jgi:hypothetical protein
VGILNAAVWLGASFLFLFVVDPASTSSEMKDLIGARNYPYFSISIDQLIAARYYHLYLACSIFALAHLTAEWLYLGRYPKRLWLGLAVSLCFLGLVQNYWLQPNLKSWHRLSHSEKTKSDDAARTFRTWAGISKFSDILVICGLTLYLWRLENPSDSARFVSATKFRS